MPRGFDPKCGELAEHFLADKLEGYPATVQIIDQADRAGLAQAIQDAAEEWLSEWRAS